jgi:hypothetical protein
MSAQHLPGATLAEGSKMLQIWYNSCGTEATGASLLLMHLKGKNSELNCLLLSPRPIIPLPQVADQTISRHTNETMA